MKNKTTKILLGLVLGVIGLVAIAAGDKFGFPPIFGDSTGTNSVTWTDPGLAYTLTSGTNTYTGITTNRAVLFGTGVTNTLVFRNGILVGIQ